MDHWKSGVEPETDRTCDAVRSRVAGVRQRLCGTRTLRQAGAIRARAIVETLLVDNKLVVGILRHHHVNLARTCNISFLRLVLDTSGFKVFVCHITTRTYTFHKHGILKNPPDELKVRAFRFCLFKETIL